MQNINFDEGYKEFTINNDENRIIKFNPSDIGILSRFDKASKIINDKMNVIDNDVELNTDGSVKNTQKNYEEAVELVNNINELIKEQINYIFASDVADIVFGLQSPISTVKGKPLFERFINAAYSFIEKDIKEEQKESLKRMKEYQKEYKK